MTVRVTQIAGDAYGRMLQRLMPPGRWLEGPAAILAKLLHGIGDELARVNANSADLWEQADITTATDAGLLTDWESLLDLEATGTEQQRRDVAQAILTQDTRARPQDFRNLLAPFLDVAAPGLLQVIELTAADAAVIAVPSRIFQFYVFRNPSTPGTPDFDAAQAQCDRLRPSHTRCTIIESTNFLTDDPDSLTDRDILGA